jgi:hypothetical protein
MRRVPIWLGLVLCTLIPAAAAGQGVTITANFTGTTLNDTFALGTNTTPPDPNGAVGPSQFVELINGAFAVYSKTGVLQTRVADTAFWLGITNDGSYDVSAELADPRVVYDPNTGRFFATMMTKEFTNNRVMVARTNAPGANPAVLSNWTATSFLGRAAKFADYPSLGIDANAIYIGTNNFVGAQDQTLTVIPKADLLLTSPTTANKTSINATNRGWTPHPVRDFAPTKTTGLFFGTELNFQNNTSLIMTTVTGTGGPGATFGGPTNIPVPVYNHNPIYAAQPDGTFDLDRLDMRLVNSPYQVGNDIWAVHSIQGKAPFSISRTALQWYRIDASAGTLLASGMLGDVGGHFDFFNASIAANAAGEVVISFTRSGDSTTGTAGRAGHYALTGTTIGTTTTFGSPILLQPGLTDGYHFIGGDGERWGDYSIVTVDPNDPHTFWLINEFALSSNRWADNIAALTFTAVPEPATVGLLVGTAVGLQAYRIRRRRRAAQEAEQLLV